MCIVICLLVGMMYHLSWLPYDMDYHISTCGRPLSLACHAHCVVSTEGEGGPCRWLLLQRCACACPTRCHANMVVVVTWPMPDRWSIPVPSMLPPCEPTNSTTRMSADLACQRKNANICFVVRHVANMSPTIPTRLIVCSNMSGRSLWAVWMFQVTQSLNVRRLTVNYVIG